MGLLALAKNTAHRVEAEASRAETPVAVCVIDVHGSVILQHRMDGAKTFAIELSERKAYTSALVGIRTAELLPLVQPGQPLFPLMSQGRYCAMGGWSAAHQRRSRGCGSRRQRRLRRARRRHPGGSASKRLTLRAAACGRVDPERRWRKNRPSSARVLRSATILWPHRAITGVVL